MSSQRMKRLCSSEIREYTGVSHCAFLLSGWYDQIWDFSNVIISGNQPATLVVGEEDFPNLADGALS